MFTVYLRFLKEIVTDSLLGNGLSVSICVWYWVLLFPLLLSFNTSWTSSVLLVDAISLQQRIAEVVSIIDRLAIFLPHLVLQLKIQVTDRLFFVSTLVSGNALEELGVFF